MQALLDELRSYLENGLALSMIEGDAVDGPGFHVDVEAVDEAARGITQSVQDQDNFELRGLCGDADLYGHAGVHDALMDFAVRWSDGFGHVDRRCGRD